MTQQEQLDVLGGDVRPISRTSPRAPAGRSSTAAAETPRDHCPTRDHRWSATQARLLAPHRLNWIECEFTALRYFTLDGSDYPSHATQEAAIAGYIRWANRRARPKQQFAVGSKIRRPDYLPNVA